MVSEGSAFSFEPPKKETAKAKSAAASKKKAVEAEAAEAHDLEEDDTENILESDVEPTDLHDDHHDVKASDLTDESLLEGVPEEELKAAAEITVPKVSHKSKSTRKRSTRKSSADSSVALLTGDPVRMYLKEIGKVSLLTAAEEIDLAMKIEAGVAATAELEKAEEEQVSDKAGTDLIHRIRLLYIRHVLENTDDKGMDPQAEIALYKILSLKDAENTEDVINVIDEIYNHVLDPSFEKRNGNLEKILNLPDMALTNDAWQECMTDEQMEDIIQKYLSNLKKKMMSLDIRNKKKKRFYFSPENEEVPESSENINPQAVRRIREYVELNYGKSYLSESEQARVNRKFCTGIHKNCNLYLTDGILQNPVIKNNQYRFSQLQFEKNKAYYGNNHWIIKRNISVLAESLKRALIIRKDDFVSRSDAGQLVPERLWKIGRTDDDKLFNRKKRSEDSEFVIDVLIDSSGSQAGRQAQVAAQGYIISEALSQAGIPHRVTGYCAFWGYTVLQRFRDYEDPRETNERIFQFRAYANNRDGLALKTVCSSLMERPEKNKILIVLSDGKPCDMSIQRPGTRQPRIYDGEGAVKDTAYEVRRARNQGIFVIGIFVGNEEELSVEKRIYGKDFAYIRNISNFSRMVGTFLRRQIDME